MADRSMAGTFVWHDLMSTDPEDSTRFLTNLLGYEAQSSPNGSRMLTSGATRVAMIIPWDASTGVPSHWLGYICVEKIDESMAQAESLGGRIVHGPMPIRQMGRLAVLIDPQGAAFGMMDFADPASLPAAAPADVPGSVHWNQLMTSDVDAAVAFYSALFGWQPGADDGHGNRLMARNGVVNFTGVFRKPDELMPDPAWVTYIRTPDLHAAIARVADLGGEILVPPMDDEEGGELAWIREPAGALTALTQPAPDTV